MREGRGTEGQVEYDAWIASNEMGHLRTIKDIRDEIQMIKKVLSEQQEVVQSIYGGTEMRKTSSTSKISLADKDKLLGSMERRLRKVDMLERAASLVEQRVSFLTARDVLANGGLGQGTPRSKA